MAIFDCRLIEMRSAAAVYALLFAVVLPAYANPRSQPLRVPAVGIVDLDAFTIEMWIRLDFDPAVDPNHKGIIFHLDYGDKAFPAHGIDWTLFSQYIEPDKIVWLRTYTNVYHDGERLDYSLLGNFPKEVKRNAWQYMSFGFDGRRRVFTVGDGSTSDTLVSGDFAHPLRSGAILDIGADWRGMHSLIVVDHIRVSAVLRDTDAIAQHRDGKAAIDRATTLLWTFDEVEQREGVTMIRPAYAATVDAAKWVALPKGASIVEGRYGPGLSFSPVTELDAYAP